MRWALIISCVVACGGRVPSAPPPQVASPTLKSADLLADLGILERTYRVLHPGLNRYLTPSQVDRLFNDARRELSRDQTRADVFLVLTKLTAAIRCGHSYPNPSNQSAEVARSLFEHPRLPWLFVWRDGQMLVTRSFVAELAAGTVVEAIEGIPTRALFAQLLPLARADGHNDAKRAAYLSVVGESDHEAFDLLAPLVAPALFAGPTIRVRVRAGEVTVPLQSAAERATATAPVPLGPDAPLWTLEWKDRVAYLKMASWVAYKTKRDWRADLEEMMAQLVERNAAGLIVDLRGNEGGDDAGDVILAHMIDAPIMRGEMRRRIRFRSVPSDLRPYLDTWDRSFFELGKDATPLAGGWYELRSEAGADLIEPRGPRYTGNLVVLIDAANSSATFQFALTVQQKAIGRLIGTPTGGSQRGINGGAFFFVRLPRTGLEVDLPLIGTFPVAEAADVGVVPDETIVATPEDVARDRDPALEAALRRANAHR